MTETTPEQVRLTADTAIFAEDDDQLYVLVIRRGSGPFEGYWALPGDYLGPDEDVMEATHRTLRQQTGLIVASVRLVGVYADPGRDPRGRLVSFAYTTRLAGLIEPIAAGDAVEARWMPVDEALCVPNRLAFDHYRIVHDALPIIV